MTKLTFAPLVLLAALAPMLAGTPASANPQDDAWHECVKAAAFVFSFQTEPAETVAQAAYAHCYLEELAYPASEGLDPADVHDELVPRLMSVTLAWVMTMRAQRPAGETLPPPLPK
jgi:hypothetical protein